MPTRLQQKAPSSLKFSSNTFKPKPELPKLESRLPTDRVPIAPVSQLVAGSTNNSPFATPEYTSGDLSPSLAFSPVSPVEEELACRKAIPASNMKVEKMQSKNGKFDRPNVSVGDSMNMVDISPRDLPASKLSVDANDVQPAKARADVVAFLATRMHSDSSARPMLAPASGRHSCGKCGKSRRPESKLSMETHGASQRPGPKMETVSHPSLNINVEPPTAISEHAPTLPFSPASTLGESPLLKQCASSEKPRRSGSISSLFRSLSSRKRSEKVASQSIPGKGLAVGESRQCYHNVHRNMTIAESTLSAGTQMPALIELDEMKQCSHGRINSWQKSDERTGFLSTQRPKHNRSQSTQTGVKQPSNEADVYIALPADQRPGMTRFKSLRHGVNRAAVGLSRSASQISRSTSLRRLETVKRVPQLWYRNDMSLEGAGSEYNQYAY